MARLGWIVLIGGLYLLHQDLWFWDDVRPLVFGFLPIGLAYHGGYCVAVSALMWALTRFAWPAHLESLQGGERAGAPSRIAEESGR